RDGRHGEAVKERETGMRRALLLASLLPSLPVAGGDVPIVFPADGGIVDVRAYGAVPDDEGDDTAAIQAALDAFPNGNRIVHLPPGVYLVSDTLSWPVGDGVGNGHRRTILQGAGEGLSILRLPE